MNSTSKKLRGMSLLLCSSVRSFVTLYEMSQKVHVIELVLWIFGGFIGTESRSPD